MSRRSPSGAGQLRTAMTGRSVVTVDVLTRPSVRDVAATEIAVTDCNAVTTGAFRCRRQGGVVRRLIVRSGRSVGEVNVKRAAVKGSAVAMIVSAPMALAVSAVNARPTLTRTRSAATTCSATRASAASMAVAFETVVVATQVSAKTTTTVVMDNCVTIKAAARLATTTNPAPRASAAKALGLGARSVWMADHRLF